MGVFASTDIERVTPLREGKDMCSFCGNIVHKRCSGISRRLQVAVQLKCAECSVSSMTLAWMYKTEVGDVSLGCAVQFCFLGDVVSAGGSLDWFTYKNQKYGSWKMI